MIVAPGSSFTVVPPVSGASDGAEDAALAEVVERVEGWPRPGGRTRVEQVVGARGAPSAR